MDFPEKPKNLEKMQFLAHISATRPLSDLKHLPIDSCHNLEQYCRRKKYRFVRSQIFFELIKIWTELVGMFSQPHHTRHHLQQLRHHVMATFKNNCAPTERDVQQARNGVQSCNSIVNKTCKVLKKIHKKRFNNKLLCNDALKSRK